MTIQDGYGDKPTHIYVDTTAGRDTVVGLWIEQSALRDTLSYVTEEELLALQREVARGLAYFEQQHEEET